MSKAGETVACVQCGAPARRVGPLAPGLAFAGRALDAPLPGGSLYRCPACALAFRWPRLSSDALNALYAAGETAHWRYDLADRRDWQIALGHLARRAPGRILDVGCFDGAFLGHVPPAWQTFGVEVDGAARAQARARGVEIVGEDAMAPLGGGPFDVITAFDLVEHMPDPLALLEAWAAALAPGGSILVGTGNAAAAAWRFMGSHYWYGAIPEHLSFISPEWCRAAAPRAGLTLQDVAFYSHQPRASRRQKLAQAGLNALHHWAPGVFGLLGRFRDPHVAGRRVAGAPPVPAGWMSARDHLMATFTRAA